MDKQNASLIEMIAGTIGVFALISECESFGYLHMMMGFILSLYVLQGIKRHKTKYQALLYSSVASLPILLTFSKPLDWVRDNFFRNFMSRDVTIALTWLGLSFILWITQRYVLSINEVANETN